MKKFLMFVMAFALLLGACERKSKQEIDLVEKTVQSDHNYMTDNYGSDYKYYETTVELNDWLDGNCDGSIASITNVFQVVYADTAGGYDAKVVIFTHNADEVTIKEVDGFWLEDFEIVKGDIKITYNKAFKRMMETNFVKPHSKYCVLRKAIGPIPCNAQYIFGNVHSQLFVDAITCVVIKDDPAFVKRE